MPSRNPFDKVRQPPPPSLSAHPPAPAPAARAGASGGVDGVGAGGLCGDSAAAAASDDLGRARVGQGHAVRTHRAQGGAPRSGQYGLTHISAGDLLRAEVAAGTEGGRQAKAHMDAGRLVPDDVVVTVGAGCWLAAGWVGGCVSEWRGLTMCDTLCVRVCLCAHLCVRVWEQIVKNRLAQEDAQSRGWLLDGYPRSLSQAQALLALDISPDVFILLNVSPLPALATPSRSDQPHPLGVLPLLFYLARSDSLPTRIALHLTHLPTCQPNPHPSCHPPLTCPLTIPPAELVSGAFMLLRPPSMLHLSSHLIPPSSPLASALPGRPSAPLERVERVPSPPLRSYTGSLPTHNLISSPLSSPPLPLPPSSALFPPPPVPACMHASTGAPRDPGGAGGGAAPGPRH
ncbi:unnamed protein product [Closterium sp. NIES-54]